MPQPPKVLHIDQLEAIPGRGTLTWRPVRRTLGIRAFGTNAYTAGAPGDDVVEPHTEEPEIHEELYFVAAGRANFTIDGQSYDAPAGTYVFVPDPASHRHAVATEADTTVLSFGGPPSFEPSAWEWIFRAESLKAAKPDEAHAILIEGIEAHPDYVWLHYNLACFEALHGHRDQAVASLRTAVSLDSEAARVRARRCRLRVAAGRPGVSAADRRLKARPASRPVRLPGRLSPIRGSGARKRPCPGGRPWRACTSGAPPRG